MSEFRTDDYGKDRWRGVGLFGGSLMAGLLILGSLMLFSAP